MDEKNIKGILRKTKNIEKHKLIIPDDSLRSVNVFKPDDNSVPSTCFHNFVQSSNKLSSKHSQGTLESTRYESNESYQETNIDNSETGSILERYMGLFTRKNEKALKKTNRPSTVTFVKNVDLPGSKKKVAENQSSRTQTMKAIENNSHEVILIENEPTVARNYITESDIIKMIRRGNNETYLGGESDVSQKWEAIITEKNKHLGIISPRVFRKKIQRTSTYNFTSNYQNRGSNSPAPRDFSTPVNSPDVSVTESTQGVQNESNYKSLVENITEKHFNVEMEDFQKSSMRILEDSSILIEDNQDSAKRIDNIGDENTFVEKRPSRKTSLSDKNKKFKLLPKKRPSRSSLASYLEDMQSGTNSDDNVQKRGQSAKKKKSVVKKNTTETIVKDHVEHNSQNEDSIVKNFSSFTKKRKRVAFISSSESELGNEGIFTPTPLVFPSVNESLVDNQRTGVNNSNFEPILGDSDIINKDPYSLTDESISDWIDKNILSPKMKDKEVATDIHMSDFPDMLHPKQNMVSQKKEIEHSVVTPIRRNRRHKSMREPVIPIPEEEPIESIIARFEGINDRLEAAGIRGRIVIPEVSHTGNRRSTRVRVVGLDIFSGETINYADFGYGIQVIGIRRQLQSFNHNDPSKVRTNTVVIPQFTPNLEEERDEISVVRKLYLVKGFTTHAIYSHFEDKPNLFGELVIFPHSEKPRVTLSGIYLILTRGTGTVRIKHDEDIPFVVKKGSFYEIPDGSSYSIINNTGTIARLKYCLQTMNTMIVTDF